MGQSALSKYMIACISNKVALGLGAVTSENVLMVNTMAEDLSERLQVIGIIDLQGSFGYANLAESSHSLRRHSCPRGTNRPTTLLTFCLNCFALYLNPRTIMGSVEFLHTLGSSDRHMTTKSYVSRLRTLRRFLSNIGRKQMSCRLQTATRNHHVFCPSRIMAKKQ